VFAAKQPESEMVCYSGMLDLIKK